MSTIDFEFVTMPSVRIEDALFAAAQNCPAKTAILAGDDEIDFETLAERAMGFAQDLRDHDLQAGDRVALFLDSTLDAVVAFFGTWVAGGIAVPIHIGLRRAQLLHILETASCRFLVTDPERRPVLRKEDLDRADGPIQPIQVGTRRAPASRPPDTSRPQGGEAPAAILFTSGSTGRPKGILVSHDNLRAGAEIVSRYLGLTRDDRILCVLPFSFDYGLSQLLCAIECQASCVLQRSPLPADICRSLVESRISVLAGVPPLWAQLMSSLSPFEEMEFPALRILTNSGGVFPVDLVARYRAHLPHAQIFLMYGFSEAFRSTFLPPEELERRPDSMGKAIPGCEVFVVDEDGRECAPGEVGELVHRGPTVTLGYWNDPEASARVFRPSPRTSDQGERVAYSGDLVRRDEEGFLYFSGRRDSMFKSMGFRISPEDVEEQLREMGPIAEVIVGSRVDETAGRQVIAHIVPRNPASFDVEALLRQCRRLMPAYMVPADIQVHTALPRTSSGKFDRKGLLP